MKALIVTLVLLLPLPAFAISHEVLNQITGANPMKSTHGARHKTKAPRPEAVRHERPRQR